MKAIPSLDSALARLIERLENDDPLNEPQALQMSPKDLLQASHEPSLPPLQTHTFHSIRAGREQDLVSDGFTKIKSFSMMACLYVRHRSRSETKKTEKYRLIDSTSFLSFFFTRRSDTVDHDGSKEQGNRLRGSIFARLV